MAASDPLAGRRPIHTRTLDVELRAAAGTGRILACGELLDVRKGGFVPIAADVQTAGLLHRMRVHALVDTRTWTLREISAEQPVVAFEASRLSEGESCRDPVARLQALVGTELGAAHDGSVLDAIGGPRGCSHVLATARLLLSSLAWLAGGPALSAQTGWREGERIFHRSLSYDGAEDGDDGLAVTLQLTDLHLAPRAEVVRPMERLAHQSEVRGRVRIGRRDLALRQLELAQRERGPEELESAGWRDAAAGLAGLAGASVARGMRRRILEALPDPAPGAPLAAALLDLTPAVLQCMASDCDHWPVVAAADPSLVISGGPPDSCWMWRREGALGRARAREQGGD